MTCPGLDAVIQHALVATQYHDRAGRGHSFYMLGRDTVLRNALVGMQFYDIPMSDAALRRTRVRTKFTTCTGRDTVIRTCPGRDVVL